MWALLPRSVIMITVRISSLDVSDMHRRRSPLQGGVRNVPFGLTNPPVPLDFSQVIALRDITAGMRD